MTPVTKRTLVCHKMPKLIWFPVDLLTHCADFEINSFSMLVLNLPINAQPIELDF